MDLDHTFNVLLPVPLQHYYLTKSQRSAKFWPAFFINVNLWRCLCVKSIDLYEIKVITLNGKYFVEN
jgi:hypothetical protein